MMTATPSQLMHAMTGAIIDGNVASARELLAQGFDVHARDPQNHHRTALHFAAQLDCVPVCAVLLEAGAEVDAQDDLERTPLWGAVAEGAEGAIDMQVRHGAVLHRVRCRERVLTPVHMADEDTVWRTLAELGADAHYEVPGVESYRTPLEFFVEKDRPAVVKAIMAQEWLDLEQRTVDGVTLLELAPAGSMTQALLHAIKTEREVVAALPDINPEPAHGKRGFSPL